MGRRRRQPGAPRDDLPRPHRRRGTARQAGDRRLCPDLPQSQAGGDRGQGARQGRHRRRRAGQGLCREAAGALCLFDQRLAHLPHRHGDRQGGLCRALSDAGRTLGRGVQDTERMARPLRRRAVRGARRHLADALLPAQRHRERAGGDRGWQAAHPADARDRHRQDRDRLPDRLGAVPDPLEPVAQAGAAAAHPVPRRPQHPGRSGLSTPSRRFPRTRWRASSRTKSARKAACRRTPACSSRSSRPS